MGVHSCVLLVALVVSLSLAHAYSDPRFGFPFTNARMVNGVRLVVSALGGVLFCWSVAVPYQGSALGRPHRSLGVQRSARTVVPRAPPLGTAGD